MIISDILVEAATTIYGRSKGKVTRKYRCTSGTRKGRIVAKAATCNAPNVYLLYNKKTKKSSAYLSAFLVALSAMLSTDASSSGSCFI